jgi:hypothetical protein
MTKRAIASFEVVEVRSAQRRTRNLKVKKKEGSEIGLKKEAGCRSRKPNLPRSWDDKASRAIRLKLAGFPLQQVRGNKNSKGQTIHPVVVEAMQSLGNSNNNLFRLLFGSKSSRILSFVEAMQRISRSLQALST